MESAFAWLNQLIEAVFRFCPRIVIVRATHAGVKWVHGWKVKAMPPEDCGSTSTTAHHLRVGPRQPGRVP